LLLALLGQAAHHTEIHENNLFSRQHGDVSGVGVGVKKAVYQDLLKDSPGQVMGNLFGILTPLL
jgi:hypothetical protein